MLKHEVLRSATLQSQTHKTGFFSSFMYWTNSTSSQCCTFLFFTWWNMNHSTTLSKPCRRPACTFTGSYLCVSGVGVVHIKHSDFSVLFFSSSLFCLCYFLNRVKYDILESTAYALLILICDVFFNNMKMFRMVMYSKKNTYFLFQFMVFLHHV